MEWIIKSENVQGYFYKIDSKNVLEKIRYIIREKKDVFMWEQEAQIAKTKLLDLENKENKIIINSSPLSEDISNNKLRLHFVFNHINYFSSINILEKANKKIICELDPYVYQYEARREERLLTFPHRKMFIYFDINSDLATENIVFLNKMRSGDTKIFKNFIRVSSDGKYVGKDNTPMTGFRLLDLSSVGASFISNAKEVQTFKENKRLKNAKIGWGNETYELKNIIINNIVDYIDPRAVNIPMYKIGIKFDKNLSLDKRLSILLYDENLKLEDKVEFLSYLKKCVQI